MADEGERTEGAALNDDPCANEISINSQRAESCQLNSGANKNLNKNIRFSVNEAAATVPLCQHRHNYMFDKEFD
jgi:hypothetical protein